MWLLHSLFFFQHLKVHFSIFYPAADSTIKDIFCDHTDVCSFPTRITCFAERNSSLNLIFPLTVHSTVDLLSTYFLGNKMRRLGNIRFKHLFCLEANILSLQSNWYILYFMTRKTLEEIACYRTKGLNWFLDRAFLLCLRTQNALYSFTNKHTLSYMRFFLCLSAF